MKIALQMYTVRDRCTTGEGLLQTIKELAKIGYDSVEFAGYAGLSGQKIKNALSESGLDVIATHESLDRLENSLDEVVSYCEVIGCKNIVCAYSPIRDENDLRHLEKVLRAAGERAAKSGIAVLYHNHSHEFKPLGSTLPIDVIKRYCSLELDTYWAFDSGNDVCAYLRNNAGRIGLIHLKDGDLHSTPCAVGEGKNDIQGIVDAAYDIGAEWLIVENDNPLPDSLSDAALSMRNLRSRYLRHDH